MVMEVKQSKYTTENSILGRVYNGAHFSIIATFFAKIIFQNNS